MYYVYVLRSLKDGRLYTGVTNNLARRMREHHAGKTKSLRYRRPLQLVYSETYATKALAMRRERFFKTPEGGVEKRRLVATSQGQ